MQKGVCDSGINQAKRNVIFMADAFEKWLAEGIALNLQQYDTAEYNKDESQMKWNKGAQNALEAARNKYQQLKPQLEEGILNSDETVEAFVIDSVGEERARILVLVAELMKKLEKG